MVVNLINGQMQNNVTLFCVKLELYIDHIEQSHYNISGYNVMSYKYSLNESMFKSTYGVDRYTAVQLHLKFKN